MKELLERVWKAWKEEEDPIAAVAYTNCYFWILECIQEGKV